MMMPVITLHMPWAFWVLMGWKPIETRTHRRFAGLVGKRIGIHASLKDYYDAELLTPRWLSPQQIFDTGQRLTEIAAMRGHIICTAFCREHRPLVEADEAGARIECRTPRWGNFLEDVRALVPAMAARGRQGIWHADIPSAV